MADNVFAMIAKGELSCYKIYEDDTHLAFLDIAPIRKGQTLVIPKAVHPSKFSAVPPEVMSATMRVAQKVAKLLEEKLENIERCLLVVEGFDVEHFHVKLYPAYRQGDHQPLTPGGTQAEKEELEKVQQQITG